MKRRLRLNRIIIPIVLIIVVFAAIKYLNYINSNYYKMKKIGYSESEITNIMDKFSNDKELIIIEKDEYLEDLNDLINEKYFMFKNLDRYLEYSKKNDKSLSDVVAIVNTNNDRDFYTNIIETDITKDELMLVNKFNHLSKTYRPSNIVDMSSQYAFANNRILESTYTHFVSMVKAAKTSGFTLVSNSSYRTYETQESLYDARVEQVGVEAADLYVARPGHSEHQTGYAIDISEYASEEEDFETTDAYQWLLDDAYRYGFILRYPLGKEHLTGYSFESWHFRYVGTSVATKMHNLDITFDEYYAFFIEGDL